MVMVARTNVKNGKSGVSATLASMASKAVEKIAPTVTVPDAAPPVAAFDWSTVAAPTVAVYARNTPGRQNVETTTPQFIKDCITSGFEKTAKNLDAKGRPSPVWLTLKLDTPARADEFLKLGKKYATSREYTMRGEANPVYMYVANPEGGDPILIEGNACDGYVRFCVKVREVRKPVAK